MTMMQINSVHLTSRLVSRMVLSSTTQARAFSSNPINRDEVKETGPEAEMKRKHQSLLESMKKRQEQRVKTLERNKAERERKLEERLNKWKLQEQIRILKEKHAARERKIADRRALNEKKEALRLKMSQKKREQKLKEQERLLKKKEGQPKRALNAFMWYFKNNYKALDSELRTDPAQKIAAPQVLKLAKERFDAFTEEERREYDELAEKDKQRYAKERATYVEERERVKKPPTSYILFSQDVRSSIVAENPEFSSVEVIRECARRWRALDEGTKQQYKDKYAQLMDEWRILHGKQE